MPEQSELAADSAMAPCMVPPIMQKMQQLKCAVAPTWCHPNRCADNKMAPRWHHPFYLALLKSHHSVHSTELRKRTRSTQKSPLNERTLRLSDARQLRWQARKVSTSECFLPPIIQLYNYPLRSKTSHRAGRHRSNIAAVYGGMENWRERCPLYAVTPEQQKLANAMGPSCPLGSAKESGLLLTYENRLNVCPLLVFLDHHLRPTQIQQEHIEFQASAEAFQEMQSRERCL